MAEVVVMDDGQVIVELPVGQDVEAATWGLFYPEGQKHPLFCLYTPPRTPLFQLFWTKEGLELSKEILDGMFKHNCFNVLQGNTSRQINIHKSRDLKALRKMRQRAEHYVPGAARG